MTSASGREAAAELARRIESSRVDPAKADEAHRPASDKPPAYADVLMSEDPAPVERTADLSAKDWELIGEALEHYASCGSAGRTG